MPALREAYLGWEDAPEGAVVPWVLRCRSTCGYGALHAVSALSLALEDGEVVSVLGANGAGKSSLLRTLIGSLGRPAGVSILAGATSPATRAGAHPPRHCAACRRAAASSKA